MRNTTLSAVRQTNSVENFSTDMHCKECNELCDDKNEGAEHYYIWKKNGFCAICHRLFIDDSEDNSHELELTRGLYERAC